MSGPGRIAKARSPPRAELAAWPTNDCFGESQMAFPAAGLGRLLSVCFQARIYIGVGSERPFPAILRDAANLAALK